MALLLLPLGAAALLAWHWEAFAARSWPEGVVSLTFTDDERFVVSCDEKALRLHDPADRLDRWLGAHHLLSVPAGQNRSVVRAFSPGRILLTGGDGATWWGFDHGSAEQSVGVGDDFPSDASAETGLLLTRGPGSGYSMRSLSRPDQILWRAGGRSSRATLSHDGRSVAIVTSLVVTTYEATTGEVVKALAMSEASPWLRFDAAGDLLVSGVGKDLRVFRSDASTPSRSAIQPYRGLRGTVGGTRLVTEEPGPALGVRDTRTEELLFRAPGALKACLSRDGKRLAFARPDRRIEVAELP